MRLLALIIATQKDEETIIITKHYNLNVGYFEVN